MAGTGANLVARELAANGVDTVFTVSGNQILPMFDVAEDAGIRLIHMRHETAAVYAAIGASESTGKPAVALVSAGPGFLASLQGLGVAASMELPILLLSGGAPTHQRAYGGFQHLDQAAIARAAGAMPFQVDQAADVPSVLRSAWAQFSQPVPRPVHVELAADALPGEVGRESVVPTRSAEQTSVPDHQSHIYGIGEQLATASRPVVIARPSATRGAAGELLTRLCDALGIRPLVTESPRGLSDLKYVGVIARLPESDCTLVIGPSDFASGFAARDVLSRAGFLAVVDAPGDPEPMHRADVHLRGDQAQALRSLIEQIDGRSTTDPEWSAIWQLMPGPPSPDESEHDGLHPLRICEIVRQMIRPEDTIILDGGEFCQWVRLGLRDLPNRMLWNGKLGAIGGSIPMAIGVQQASQRAA